VTESLSGVGGTGPALARGKADLRLRADPARIIVFGDGDGVPPKPPAGRHSGRL